jgi:outer membrane lipoprotein SlyB
MTTGVLSGFLVALTATAAMAQTAYDDQVCRQWASQNANYAQAQANNNAVGSTLGGALLGAGLGAAIGGGRGAAIGAASGAIVGTGAGAAQAQGAGNNAFWQAYNYCMSTRAPAPPPPAYGAPPPGYQGGYNPYYGR